MAGPLLASRRLMAAALIAPPLAVFGLFFVLPLASLLWVSLHGASASDISGGDLTLENYVKIATDPFYHTIILRTLNVAAAIVLACLVLGYATAYLLAPLPPRRRMVLMLLLIVPLMVSNVIRAYGWTAVLGRQGLVNALLHGLGLIQRPLVMLNDFNAVAFGLMTILLPYMVISITNALTTIDTQYREAAQSLKANPIRTFIHVIWPLSSPGVVSGLLLVFLLTLSAYVTITLLGGPRMKLLVSLVFDEVTSFRWPLAAALSFALLGLALVVSGLIFALFRPGRVQGRG